MASFFRALWNSPVGPKTTHFWGPASNCGIVGAAMMDAQRSPELISGKMTIVMCLYSASFMRFAWMIKPRNYFLLGTHMTNESVQLYQLSRWASFHGYFKEKNAQAASN